MTVTRERILSVEDEQDTRDVMGVPLGGDEAVNAASVSDALENTTPGELALAYLIIG